MRRPPLTDVSALLRPDGTDVPEVLRPLLNLMEEREREWGQLLRSLHQLVDAITEKARVIGE